MESAGVTLGFMRFMIDRPVVHCILDDVVSKWNVDGQLVFDSRRAIPILHPATIQIYADDRKVKPQGDLHLPPHKLSEVSRLLANENHQQLRAGKSLSQLPLDAFFLARVPRCIDVMRVVKIHGETIMGLPRGH